MTTFMLNLGLMALWIASTGAFTYANALLGFVVGLIVLWWLQPLVGGSAYFRKLPLALGFAVVFAWELLKSNLRVAWDVVTPQRLRRPGIIAVPLDAKTDLEITVLANLITLTPGSMSMELSADRRLLYVHEMFVEDPELARQAIKERYERWVLALLR